MKSVAVQKPTVLVVEDEHYVRESLTAYLDDIGYRVLTAENGRSGLELFRSRRPDIVMTDLRMPVMDGFALLAGDYGRIGIHADRGCFRGRSG